MTFDGAKVSGSVVLPEGVYGEFIWQGENRPLSSGETMLG